MGRGDGSFAGAPVLPFVYNGHNMVDLNHDGAIDILTSTNRGTFIFWGKKHAAPKSVGKK